MTAIHTAHKKGMIHPAEYSAHVERVLAAAKRPSIVARVVARITGIPTGISAGKKRK